MCVCIMNIRKTVVSLKYQRKLFDEIIYVAQTLVGIKKKTWFLIFFFKQ